MGLDSFGKKAKNAIRAAVLGGAVVSGAAMDSGTKAEAQTIRQESSGNNSPNIIGSGNVVIGGSSSQEGRPNVSFQFKDSMFQKSERDNSPNIITNDDVVIIDGKPYYRKK